MAVPAGGIGPSGAGRRRNPLLCGGQAAGEWGDRPPREFVDSRKQSRLRAAAACYLSARALDVPARFDVAEVYEEADGALRITYLEDAFI